MQCLCNGKVLQNKRFIIRRDNWFWPIDIFLAGGFAYLHFASIIAGSAHFKQLIESANYEDLLNLIVAIPKA